MFVIQKMQTIEYIYRKVSIAEAEHTNITVQTLLSSM